ncbi:hypothetical protein EDB85DRAFT_2149282 [Lactarius pseudohatsudake]|nr:hypothetical protein EDB85DRAFT_2149282 [Lactarius pseudohatsudake]
MYPLLFHLPPPSPMFSTQAVEKALLTGDIFDDGGDYDDDLSPPSPSPRDHARRGISHIIDTLWGIDPHCDKPQLMAELLDFFNYPTPNTEGLTPLHWLGLNPLVILGAPAGHFSPPPPPDTTQMDDLKRFVSDAFAHAMTPFGGLLMALEETVAANQASVDKKLDFLARNLLSSPVPASTPSSPPSSTPIAALALDVEMAHPPAAAPVPPPAPAPAAPCLTLPSSL